MSSLEQWMDRNARRAQRRPRLDEALLTERSWRYVTHRLSYLGLRVVARTAFHVIEIMLIVQTLPPEWAAVFIGYRTLTGLFGGLYWGALESLRVRVRGSHAAGRFEEATAQIEAWLGLALGLGACGLAAVMLWIAYGPREEPGLTWGDVFGVACFLKLAATLVVRTLHSGIFALRRIYRPLWSLLVVEVVDFAALILLWPRLGLAALVVQVLVSGIVRSAIALYFTREAYTSSRLPLPRLTRAWRNRRRVLDDLGSAGVAALASLLGQLDGFMVVLFTFEGADEGLGSLPILYYVLRPLMASAHDWTRAFYMDFSRLSVGTSQFFRRRLRRVLTRTAAGLSLLLTTMVGLSVVLVWGDAPPWSVLALVPFFLARSLLSLRHVEAFAAGQHVQLASVAVVVMVVTTALARVADNAGLTLLGASVLLVAIWVFTPADASATTRATRLVGVARWLSVLLRTTSPVSLGIARVDRTLAHASPVSNRLVRALASGALTRVGRAHVLWFEEQEACGLPSAKDVAMASAGCLASAVVLRADNGAGALALASARGCLPDALLGAWAGRRRAEDSLASLTLAFQQRCPTGSVLNARSGTAGSAMSRSALHDLVRAIRREAGSRGTHQGRPSCVAIYAPHGEPETVFIAPAGVVLDPEFRRLVYVASLRATVRDT